MPESVDKYFGYLIAFGLPGFLLVWGVSLSSPNVAHWLADNTGKSAPTVGGFLYSTIASLACGVLLSGVRWFLFDFPFRLLFEPKPSAMPSKDELEVYRAAIDNHYRFFQCYAHSALAIALASAFYVLPILQTSLYLVFIIVVSILILSFKAFDELAAFHKKV